MKYNLATLISCVALINFVASKDCLTRPKINYGAEVVNAEAFHLMKSFPNGFKLVTRCVDGFDRFIGNAQRKCSNGRWKGSSLICKKDLRCPDLGQIEGATRHGSNFYLGSAVTFSCKPGLLLKGNSKLTCLKNNVWSSEPPICKRSISCPEAVALPHSNRTDKKLYGLDGFGPNDVVTYICHPGYEIALYEIEQQIHCLADGSWDQIVKKCSPMECEEPTNILHGNFTPIKDVYSYQDSITYTCEEGYETTGGNVTRCGEDGFWLDVRPECKVLKCPDPLRPKHSRRIGNNFFVGDSVSFVCEEGYILTGSKNRTCQENLKWSGILPICEAEIKDSDCPDPGIPIGATREGHRFMVRDSVTYTCGEDFLLEGNATRYCLENGHWSGRETFCRYKYSYDDPDTAALKFTEKLDILSLVTVDSETGRYLRQNTTVEFDNSTGRSLALDNPYGLDLHLAIDISGSIDNVTLETVKSFCKAIVNKVGASDKKDGTRVSVFTFADEVDDIVKTVDIQTPEYINQKIDELSVNEGGATAIRSVFEEIRDYINTARSNKDKRKSSFAIIVLTDGKHNVYGDPSPVAQTLIREGVDMYAIGVGETVNNEILEKIASEGQYTRLKDMSKLEFIVNEIVNSNKTNRYGDCGVGGLKDLPSSQDIHNHMEAKDIQDWPWMVGLYYKNNVKYVLQCGASIIGRQWLLTAAHCFRKSGSDVAKWHVKAGSLDRDDKVKAIVLHLEKIIIHPEYKDKPHELNDIALLQLQTPLEYNPKIRPVCLPNDVAQYLDEDEAVDWYADNQDYVVNGWGGVKSQTDDNDNAVFLSDVLKYIIMPKQTDEVCKKSAPKKVNLIYEKMYCAGDEKLDACKGDSGGPSMREVDIGDRKKRMFQVGVVSFGYGCKQEGRYGYYTRVVDFLDWIEETRALYPLVE